MKQFFALPLALALCLSLAACGGRASTPDDVVGDDWRVSGVVRDSGIITRRGEDTDVLVCVHDDSAAFYCDTEEQTLYDSVAYPLTLSGDPWEKFRSIDFADRNGDGNSDVAMLFDEDGGSTLMVWFWDADSEAYVFRPEESLLSPAGGESGDHSGLDGTWYLGGEESSECVIGIGVDGDWILYAHAGDTLTAIDGGTIRAAEAESGHYTADSEVYEGRFYLVVTAGDNSFYWGEAGAFDYYERLP